WQLWFPFVVLLLVPVGLPLAPWTVRLVTAWSARLLAPAPAKAQRQQAARTPTDWGRCAALLASSALHVPLFLFSLACFGLGFGIGLVFLIPIANAPFRWLANARRHWAGSWCGVTIDRPYTKELKPELRPDGLYRVRNNLYKTEAMANFNARWLWTWHD